LARRRMQLSAAGATLAATAFALGGYLTAQVEHVNQLQGLAWMPWLMLVLGGEAAANRRSWIRRVLWGALIVTLQLLAGHTQSLFISAVSVAVFRIARDWEMTVGGRWQRSE